MPFEVVFADVVHGNHGSLFPGEIGGARMQSDLSFWVQPRYRIKGVKQTENFDLLVRRGLRTVLYTVPENAIFTEIRWSVLPVKPALRENS